MASKFVKQLSKYSGELAERGKFAGWMCIEECFMGYNPIYWELPFDEHLQSDFPVLEGTPHANIHLLTPRMVQMLGTLSQIPDRFNQYEKKIRWNDCTPANKRII